MPVEIEAKMHVRELPSIAVKLRELGATLQGDVLETNTFYDTEDRALLAGDRGLRIRSAVSQQTGVVTATMTYKGPRLHGMLKSRDELETTLGDPLEAGALLEALGYKPVLSFEKRRESWELGGCRVELDELPHIGCFVEVEGPGEEPVLHVRSQLGLAAAPLIRTSYIALLKSYLAENNVPGSVVRFER